MKRELSKKDKRQLVKAVLSGNRSEVQKILTRSIEYPLFWEKQGNHYVAGPYRLTENKFLELQKTNPCFVG